MKLNTYIEALQSDLTEVASLGDAAAAETAQRLTLALRASIGLRLLDALAEAAVELTAQLPGGHIEVRLAGQDPQLVYVEDVDEASTTAAEDATARISLRLPEALKTSIEAAATREGVSVNAWLVRALTRSVGGPARPRVGNRLTGFGKS
jgi:hypothetical protein